MAFEADENGAESSILPMLPMLPLRHVSQHVSTCINLIVAQRLFSVCDVCVTPVPLLYLVGPVVARLSVALILVIDLQHAVLWS